jgi:hypothetical protein
MPLTGIWKKDSPYIQITTLGNPTIKSRLIMGFGPSASGKTYWAKTLLSIFSSADPLFPSTFISIDGGIQRETSIAYQYIVEQAKLFCISGFSNLVISTWKLTEYSLFNASIIKKSLLNFLKQQTIPLSLYVPETLGDCGYMRLKTCASKYSTYIDITRDSNWIGVLIWQHKTANECDLPSKYTCVGCTESGIKREQQEGKKYSNSSYAHSMREGKHELAKAPGGQYMIHNSGSRTKLSIIQDYTNYALQENMNIYHNFILLEHSKKYKYIKMCSEPV